MNTVQLVPSDTRKLVPSDRKKRKNRLTYSVFIFGLIFSLLTVALFFLKDYIPKPQTTPSTLVSPRVEDDKLSVFKKGLVESNIEYESIIQASTSATLIIKFNKDSFAYVNIQKDPIFQIKTISEILTKTVIENPDKKIKYIDLRFEKAVVKYQ